MFHLRLSSHVGYSRAASRRPLISPDVSVVLPVLQAVSIVGDEVFSFSMSLTPNATEGAGYADTSKTDGQVKLRVGCIRVVYLHRFIMSLLVSLEDRRTSSCFLLDQLASFSKPFVFFPSELQQQLPGSKRGAEFGDGAGCRESCVQRLGPEDVPSVLGRPGEGSAHHRPPVLHFP